MIGPGGRVIRSIIEETKCTIDVEDDGTVFIGSTSEEAANRAMEIIQGLTREVEIGQIYTGKVTRTTNFGAFVELMPGGKEGLVRISELADYRVPSVEDVVKVGDEIMVKVIEIDNLGRVNLSRRAVLEGGARARRKERARNGEGEEPQPPPAPTERMPVGGPMSGGRPRRPGGYVPEGRSERRPPRRPGTRPGMGSSRAARPTAVAPTVPDVAPTDRAAGKSRDRAAREGPARVQRPGLHSADAGRRCLIPSQAGRRAGPEEGTMPQIRVVVSGTGKMGKEILAAVCGDADLEPVGVLEKFSAEEYVSLPDGSGLVHLDKDPRALFSRARPDVVIDFTNAEWTPQVVKAALESGVRMVIGTTGLSEDVLSDLERGCKEKRAGRRSRLELRHRRRADDAPGEDRVEAPRPRRDHRAAPQPEAGRPFGHGDRHREGHAGQPRPPVHRSVDAEGDDLPARAAARWTG